MNNFDNLDKIFVQFDLTNCAFLRGGVESIHTIYICGNENKGNKATHCADFFLRSNLKIVKLEISFFYDLI